MKHQFAVTLFLLFITSMASADLVHKFNNPAFNGAGYSSHVMAIEQLQKNRQDELDAEAERLAAELERADDNSVLAKFTRNLESRIYATLSKQMVDNMFAECGDTCSNTGTAEVEGNTIMWSRDPTSGDITLIVDGPDGYTEITIPGAGDFNF